MKKFIPVVIILVIGAIVFWSHQGRTAIAPTLSPTAATDSILDPAWITKKSFGIYVSPGHSPITPERFAGFHTGVDFETTPAEANIAIPVPAFCDGKLLLKEWASGYGGVAVQSCTLAGQAVTVIYGHLNIDTVRPSVGDSLKKGDFIGNLGKGYSTETDGERKHLHLGIHKGTTVNIIGYASSGEDNLPVSGHFSPSAGETGSLARRHLRRLSGHDQSRHHLPADSSVPAAGRHGLAWLDRCHSRVA